MSRYGYVGIPGAYGEEAVLTHYKETVEPVSYPSPLEIVLAIQAGQIDGGILPVKHTTTGTVQKVVDLLTTTELAQAEKFSVSVQHCLLALPGQTIRDLRQVHGEDWALEQCAPFLRDLDIEPISECDAATYAMRIGQEQLTQVGILASARAASLHHLEVVAEDIQADDENLTRYVLLRPSPIMVSIGSPRITRVLGPGDSPRITRVLGPEDSTATARSRMTRQTEQTALTQAHLREAHPGDGWRASPLQAVSNGGGEVGSPLALQATPCELPQVATDGPNDGDTLQAPGVPALVLKDVCKSFGKRKKRQLAVDHLTLVIEQGEIFGLLGPNGAGKTTTINLLCGLLKPSSGSIHVLGFNISQRRQARHMRARLGVVSQETALYGELTAQQNLEFQAGLYGLSRKLRQERIQAVLELVGLLAVKDSKRVSSFSGGMKRRLLIARALLHDPDLLILDEPTLGVDVQSKMAIWSHIKALRSQGKTVLLTTNTLEEAQELCSRIAILDHGKFLVMDTLEGLSAQYGDGALDVDTAHVSRQVERLRAFPGVTSVSQQGIHLHLRARGMDDQLIAQVLTLLAQEGEVLRFSVQKPTLDEIFLELTGAGLRD